MADLNHTQIQGNTLAGFNKDHQVFLFLEFTDATKARAWLSAVKGEVATTEEVLAFNQVFKLVHSRRGHASNVVQATWMNLAISARGLEMLGVSTDVVAAFPEAFRSGLDGRAEELGHLGESAPENWRPAFPTHRVHAVMIVASDDPEDLQATIDRFMLGMGEHAVDVVDRFDGDSRSDEKGHEHFGFKDGVSQPDVWGFPTPVADAPTFGLHDPIQPGEFVLGYPTEPAPVEEQAPAPRGSYGSPPPPPPPPESETPGPDSGIPGVDWAVNGSFLVVQRLRQNVAGFKADTATQAAAAGIDPELFRAKLVGRHRSGCPMEPVDGGPDATTVDLGLTDSSVLEHDRVNAFGYSSDPDGTTVPRGAHIRKANPRDQEPPGVHGSRERRIMRRGIAYGDSFHDTAPAGSPGHADTDRGLIFACYQADIEAQFEFIQQTWVNHPNFPQEGDGADPILSESADQFNLPGAATTPFSTGGWITMTGGEYFFQPSIAAIEKLGSGEI